MADRSSAKVGKSVVSLDALLDQEYGSLFEVTGDGRQLARVKRCAARHGALPTLSGLYLHT